jgi:hypothetical protein
MYVLRAWGYAHDQRIYHRFVAAGQDHITDSIAAGTRHLIIAGVPNKIPGQPRILASRAW